MQTLRFKRSFNLILGTFSLFSNVLCVIILKAVVSLFSVLTLMYELHTFGSRYVGNIMCYN